MHNRNTSLKATDQIAILLGYDAELVALLLFKNKKKTVAIDKIKDTVVILTSFRTWLLRKSNYNRTI